MHEKNLGLPLPRRGRGSGGWGEESKLKAGLAGEEKGKPPCGCRKGRGGRRQRGQAPRRAPQRQGQQATNRDKPPLGAWFAPFPSAAWVQPRGCKGRSPLHEKTLVSPFPTGEGGRGIGGRKVNQRQGRQARKKASPPAGAGTAGAAGGKEGKPPLSFPQRQGEPVPPGECNPPPPKEISKILLTR